jgi:hypothetical protein
MARFRARIESAVRGGHMLVVPGEVADTMGLGPRSRVKGTLAGAPYRSNLMRSGDTLYLGVHKATLAAAGVASGATVAITIERDDEARPDDEVPRLLAAALAGNAAARQAWDALAPSHRREHNRYVGEAKKDETRRARVERTVRALLDEAS